jgi:hypothetical protein
VAADGAQTGTAADRTALIRLFDDTRKRLVETGTRNRLVHVNRANQRGNVLNLVNERSDDVFAILSSGKSMRFLASERDGELGTDTVATTESASEFDEHRYTDAFLETRLGPDALQKRLLKIASEAKTAEDESGVNVLYLALGFVTWFEDKSSAVTREAPLVLVPVELKRNARTSTFDLRLRDDDLETNLPLQQRWKDDFGLDLPTLEVDQNWKPSDYFAAVQAVIAHRDRWLINADAMQLGFFSFSKLLMYRDLALDAWPDGAIGDHALTRGLLCDGFGNEPLLFGESERLDEVLPPQKLFHVVDADASQAKVIEEVRTGRNLVVQGPPGTGKSQTITNIIAAAANDGKRVLFVAEKMAALSVVHTRLVKVGLRDICLELHSRSANKKIVLGELSRTISAGQSAAPAPNNDAALLSVRDQLNCIADLIHRPLGNSGETPYTLLGAQARFLSQGASPPKLKAEGLATLTRDEEQVLVSAISEFGALLAAEGDARRHPLAGLRRLDLQPVELARIEVALRAASETFESLAAAIAAAQTALALAEPPSLYTAARLERLLSRLDDLPKGGADAARAMLEAANLPRLKDALAVARVWREAHVAASGPYVEAAFSQSAAHLHAPLAAGVQSFFARWGGTYRKASQALAGLLREPLPKAAAARLKLVDALCDLEVKRKAWEEEAPFCARHLGDEWRGDRSNFGFLSDVAEWCAQLQGGELKVPAEEAVRLAGHPKTLMGLRSKLQQLAIASRDHVQQLISALDFDAAVLGESDLERAGLTSLAQACSRMADNFNRYPAWCRLSAAEFRLRKAGLGELVDALQDDRLDPAAAATEFRFARVEQLWTQAVRRSEALAGLRELDRQALVAKFAELERGKLKHNVSGILARHLQQVPQGAQGEMAVVRGEIGRKRGHMPLRKLFVKAGEAVQRIKPVLLMSPISVAQYLPPGRLKFDLLVIDEASQVRPEDALGAIARADQIVVVGDKKQLPPTSFFDRLLADDGNLDDDDDGAEALLQGAASAASMESILTLCEARGLGSRMLKWHYRSRDPSLIAVSNREFYDGELVLPPSPLQKDPAYGLCFTRIDGIYDRGGKRDNRKEGEAVVDRIADHARAHPDLSLGVVTFSFAQRNLITELLDARRKQDAELDAFLREGQSEDVFVKNIENVQGDERDVILVSVGYGPSTLGGRPSSSFGPVNGEGGERRLNVLFTRARVRCEVFASFDPGDIDASRSLQEGPRVLKRFLEFAKHGRIDDSAPTGETADSPFEEDVADVIRGLGFLADPQVGAAGFRIDLGVRHPDKPGTYLLAVECDGATYHSALWARERDRLRQDVLETLGWRFHRIWSTDWFYRRKPEIDRLRQALEAARAAAEQGVRIEGANKGRPPVVETKPVEAEVIEAPEVVQRKMPAYRRYEGRVRASHEPHEAPLSMLDELVRVIVEAEGPVHLDEIARRVAVSFGKEKAGARIVASTRTALASLRSRDAFILCDADFWFNEAQAKSLPVRDRSAETGATLKAASISLLEIREALRIAREDNAGGDDEDLIRSAARLLGFKRVGPDLRDRILQGL